MGGDRRPPHGAAPCPGEDDLRVCVDIPGLSMDASQERFWPSRVGRCEGPPHSYVHMPFALPSAAITFQRRLRSIMATRRPGTTRSWQRWRRFFTSLPRFRTQAACEEQPLQHASSTTSTSLQQRCHVTFSGSFSWGRPSGCIIPRLHGPVPTTCILCIFNLLCWGRPSGCIIPRPHGSVPVACIVFTFT